ncbi:hypothetical protein BVD23_13050 [Salmonella enterica]|nr:hypothetical protein [Salmonella enterica]ECJ5918540.1 hypothetical protein [Salmonella enterica subsp. salamae]EAN4946640.1 hypothetical protein [Salmonella enterica]EAX8456982.1 hypothetical protein [Salmonella enterica]EAX8554654.1 hypothetical protein [Salmonella enterica]
MDINSSATVTTPLLQPSNQQRHGEPVAEIVNFQAHGEKPRYLMCIGTSMACTGALSAIASGLVASVSSGSVYSSSLVVVGASTGLGIIGMMTIGAGLYLQSNSIRTHPAYP